MAERRHTVARFARMDAFRAPIPPPSNQLLDLKTRQIAKRISKVAKLVGTPEVHHHTVTSGAVSVSVTDDGSTAAQLIALTTISQGDTDTTRTGDKIRALTLTVKGNLICADTTNVVRLLIVCNYNGGTSSTLQDFLEAGDTTGYQWMSLRSHDRVGKYAILWDRTFNLSTAGSKYQACFKKTIKLSKKMSEITYSSGGTSPLMNSLYLIAISDSSAVTHPTMNYYARLRFTDI